MYIFQKRINAPTMATYWLMNIKNKFWWRNLSSWSILWILRRDVLMNINEQELPPDRKNQSLSNLSNIYDQNTHEADIVQYFCLEPGSNVLKQSSLDIWRTRQWADWGESKLKNGKVLSTVPFTVRYRWLFCWRWVFGALEKYLQCLTAVSCRLMTCRFDHLRFSGIK